MSKLANRTEVLDCGNCNTFVNFTVKEERLEIFVFGESFYVDGRTPYCNLCDDEIHDSEIKQDNQNKAFQQYREKYGVLSPKEITSARENLGLTKEEFSIEVGIRKEDLDSYESNRLLSTKSNARIKDYLNKRM